MTAGAGDGPRPGRAVRMAGPGDRLEIAAALADAFFDDPVMAWILADEGSRVRRLSGLFSTLLKGHYLPLHTVWTTDDRSAASLWAPPGRAIIPAPTVLRHIPMLLRSLGTRSIVALRALSHVEQKHPKEPHWYLGVLGTRRVAQGKGIGTSLLTPVLNRCDEEGVPAFLESSKERNIAFYRRFGFEVTSEIQLPMGGPTVWPMWRDPRPPESRS